MDDEIAKVLIDRQTIARRVAELADEITGDLTALEAPGNNRQGVEVTMVPILSGSFMFVADLIRHLPLRMQIRMLAVSSYPGRKTTTRGARIESQLTNLPETLEGCHVLLIDDILDSGHTLRLAEQTLRQRHPETLKTCVLLRKLRGEQAVATADYVAFEVPDEFVVGYGLDYDDYYRNLPEIVILRPEVFRDR